jgi:hypothetical protein
MSLNPKFPQPTKDEVVSILQKSRTSMKKEHDENAKREQSKIKIQAR